MIAIVPSRTPRSPGGGGLVLTARSAPRLSRAYTSTGSAGSTSEIGPPAATNGAIMSIEVISGHDSTKPRCPDTTVAITSAARRPRRTRSRAMGSSRSPASVRRMPEGVRRNSRAPIWRSSPASWRDTVGWVRYSAAAPALTEPWSTTAMNASRSRSPYMRKPYNRSRFRHWT